MQISRETLTPTSIKLTVTADQKFIDALKVEAVSHLGRNAKVQGFRAGKAPLHIIEKQLDPQLLQSEFLEHAVNQLYVDAAQEEHLRPVSQPQVSITKFVPFDTLEVVYEVEVVGKIVLPDFTKLKLAKKTEKVTAKDVDDVLANLRTRAASKEDVTRASKDGDQVTIDFSGVDAESKQAIPGTEGKDYPLVLGSGNFIPGFEEELVGLKADATKTFDIVFPADYGATELQNKKVTFTVIVKSVQKMVEPKLDDDFAKTVGPFDNLAQLKDDIKKQIGAEREQQEERQYENELLELIADKSKIDIPTSLVDEEIDRIEEEDRRNIVYRGQTWQEHLDAEGVNAEQHREKQRPGAELRVKAGLILGEIAEQNGLRVEAAEIDEQIAQLRTRYTDPTMQAELDKPENRRDVGNRIMSQKALDFVKSQVASK
ncbi:MAG: Trigger factor [Candidatus Saccharibacteria bacterium]|nr:Trigger factor [Candidatus Saccharibacteria bacterium]